MSAQLICIIGAESTGKTTLARMLAQHFQCPWVAEYLREFCDEMRRTPTRDEQSFILRTQIRNENTALQHAHKTGARFVFCDTSPLLTAIYSDFVFGDASLYAQARDLQQQRYALTLLLDNDLPWQADGLQRDGPHLQAPVKTRIERELAHCNVRFIPISGHDEIRNNAAQSIILRTFG